ncbi:hypothetical protein DX914_16505 [Lysobacter silvisoli]|uniref:Uncharacterized protein n=1 Tax=Lysobacter silvisoli TaxID=2293254 RepID=A0A371JY46_9GAMM|nr:hypothetical protein DX914_16505 [Lysobacter silvisoli]
MAAAAAAQPAAALPPLKAEIVDDSTLATLSGKFYGANMLVGLRIDLVSTMTLPDQSSASASGALSIRRVGNGFDVRVDTRADASAGSGGYVPPDNTSASGGDSLRVNGIGQISQVAGDGNRLSNLTSISFVSDLGNGAFNGRSAAQASAGPVTAQVTFLDGGARMDINAPGALLSQRFNAGSNGADGRILQVAQIAGNDLVGANRMHLQLMTESMTQQMQQQLGIQQVLAGLRALPR